MYNVHCTLCTVPLPSLFHVWKFLFKGTVSREKLLKCGLGEMDWTLTIDSTWVLHFSDKLFNCYNFFNLLSSRCKTCLMTFSNCCVSKANFACCWCSPMPAVSCCCNMQTFCAVVAVCTLILSCCFCGLHPNTVRTPTIHCYRRKQLSHVIFSVLTVAVCTQILCGLQHIGQH